MSNQIDDKHNVADDEESIKHDKRELLEFVSTLPSMEAINCILAQEEPDRIVKDMSRVDLFWLVKRVGAEDAAPLLQLASEDQWQYLLDMELWERDRVDFQKAYEWVARLFSADEKRLTKWLFGEGQLYSHHFFYHGIQVFLKKDDDQEFPKEFITLDGSYYIKILDEAHREEIEKFLRAMAKEDFDKFQALLLGVMGSLPAEMEEELFRLRGVRLAEDGYLPFDEALEVYSHLNLKQLKKDKSEYDLYLPTDEESKALVPITPLLYARGPNMITELIGGIEDPAFKDRLSLEFGGLCNQIISADGIIPNEIDILKDVCMKSAGYINLGLEKLSGKDLRIAEEFVRNNPLVSLFRAGFSLALELKWEAQKWIKHAWYSSHSHDNNFWGDEWGGTLSGLLLIKPRLFTGIEEDREYKDFENLNEIKKGRDILYRLIILDRLLETITVGRDPAEDYDIENFSTFHPLIFTYWIRELLGLQSGIWAISLEDAKKAFVQLREGDKARPFKMSGYQEVFINDLVQRMPDLETEDEDFLRETLSIIWQQFVEEYAQVEIDDFDVRFMKFLFIGNNLKKE